MCSWCDLNETTFELDIVIILPSKQVSESAAFRGSAVLGLAGVVRSIMNVPTARAACSSAVHRCWLSSSRANLLLGPAAIAFTAHSRDVSVLAKQEEDLDSMMAEDMQQFGAKPASKDMPPATPAEAEASEGGLKDILDKVLIGDFFFILLALLWFGVAIGLSASNVATGPLDAWYNLWKPVFQPALGVLMVGALVSGFTGRKEQ